MSPEPISETTRLEALAGYAVLDTPREAAFDDVVDLVCAFLDTPMALVSLVAEDRQWFKAERGLGVRETPLTTSFCVHAIREDEVLLVPDARLDPRFAENPLVTGPPGLRAYAGAVLRSAEGAPLGALCALDVRPRTFTPGQMAALKALARQVTAQLELRRALKEKREGEARFRQILDGATDHAIFALDLEGRVSSWNEGARRLFGHAAEEAVGRDASFVFTPEDVRAGAPAREAAQALREGRAAEERWHQRRDGARFWASGELTPLRDAEGRAIGLVKVLTDRTREHLAELTLQEAQERLNLSLENAPILGLWEWRIDDDLVVADARFAAMFGLPPQPAGGAPLGLFLDGVHPDDRERLEAEIGSALRTGSPFSSEYRTVTPDGAVHHLMARGRAVRDAAGQPVRFPGVVVDVSQQREAERTLRITQAAGGVGAFELHPETGRVDVTAEFCSLWGLPPADATLTVAELTERVLPPDRVLLGTAEPELAAGALDYVEYRIRRADTGEVRWMARRGQSTGEGAGRRHLGVVYDVTERKRGEEGLREANLGRELAMGAAQLGRFDHDLVGGSRFYDARALSLLELSLAEAQDGELLLARVHPDDRGAVREALRAAFDPQRTGPYRQTYRVAGPSGVVRWVSVNGRTLFENGVCSRFLGVMEDVTERKQVEQRLRELNEGLEAEVQARTAELGEREEELRQAQKMEAVGQLTGGIAHDFNNLLTGVTGSLELLQVRLAQGRYDAVDRYVQAAQGAARRAATLTQRLLAFSRRQTLAPKPTDINRLVAGMEELVRRTVGPGVEVEVAAAPHLGSVLVDAGQLENALLNLCINARDAMPDGGRLTITTAATTLEGREAAGAEVPPGVYVTLSVTDTGTGMTPEVIARAFDPFFTTKPLGQGTGLGLSMIYGFARQSGGQVRITSEPGRGTTMSLDLPCGPADTRSEEDPAPATPSATPALAGGRRALVVDDEATVRMLVCEVLSDMGLEVAQAADGPAGVRAARAAPDERLDLLITDVGLPGGMNGRQVADAVRALRPGTPVLLITGYADAEAVGPELVGPGMEVLTKPFALDALRERVRAMLG